MGKSTRNIYIISGILFGLAALYLAGGVMLSSAGLEYRFRVDVLGKCLCMMVLPLWLGCVGIWKLWQRFRENTMGKWLIRLLGGAAAAAGLVWCCLAGLMIPFSVNEDRSLGGGLVVVAVESVLDPTRYVLYESAGPFFRRETSQTPEVMADYLTAKYKREFYPVEKDGETFYVDAEREVIQIKVEFIWGELWEDYPQALADYYLAEGRQALGLKWDSCVMETKPGEEHFCLVLDEEKNDLAFGADVYRLMQYALEKEPMLEKYDVSVYLSYRGQWAYEGFGRTRQWKSLSTRIYKNDAAKVAQCVRWAVDSMRILAYQRILADVEEAGIGGMEMGVFPKAAGAVPADTASAPQPASQPTMGEMIEAEYPGQCEAAEAVWEAELKDLGYDFEIWANAKGHLVIRLGKHPADNLQSASEQSDYYLNYDRESRNGNCYLFVLTEVPEGYALSGAYLREFYACEKETLKVAVGNKTSWSQVGSAEYRELTGE